MVACAGNRNRRRQSSTCFNCVSASSCSELVTESVTTDPFCPLRASTPYTSWCSTPAGRTRASTPSAPETVHPLRQSRGPLHQKAAPATVLTQASATLLTLPWRPTHRAAGEMAENKFLAFVDPIAAGKVGKAVERQLRRTPDVVEVAPAVRLCCAGSSRPQAPGPLRPLSTSYQTRPHAPCRAPQVLVLLGKEAQYGIEIVPRGVTWEPPQVMVRRPGVRRCASTRRGARPAAVGGEPPAVLTERCCASGGSDQVRSHGDRRRRRQPRRVARGADGALFARPSAPVSSPRRLIWKARSRVFPSPQAFLNDRAEAEKEGGEEAAAGAEGSESAEVLAAQRAAAAAVRSALLEPLARLRGAVGRAALLEPVSRLRGAFARAAGLSDAKAGGAGSVRPPAAPCLASAAAQACAVPLGLCDAQKKNPDGGGPFSRRPAAQRTGAWRCRPPRRPCTECVWLCLVPSPLLRRW